MYSLKTLAFFQLPTKNIPEALKLLDPKRFNNQALLNRMEQKIRNKQLVFDLLDDEDTQAGCEFCEHNGDYLILSHEYHCRRCRRKYQGPLFSYGRVDEIDIIYGMRDI